MQLISFIGIVVAIALFILFAIKGINIILAGIVASLIMIFTSGMDIMGLITQTWASGFSGFMNNYFIIFALSAIFGKLLGDSGAAKQIAWQISGFICRLSKKHERTLAVLTIPILYTIMSYVGMSAWVIVFTILDIGWYLLKRLNVPWRLYCYGGSGGFIALVIPGSLLLGNVQATSIAGVQTTAAPVLGICSMAVFFVVLILFINYELKKADKLGEGFDDTGAAYAQANSGIGQASSDENLPHPVLAVIPLVVVIVTSAVLQWPVMVAMALGVLSCIIFLWKHLPNPLTSVTSGLVIMIAATTALASVLRAVPGFSLITGTLNTLPNLFGGVLFGVVATLLISTPASAISAFGADIMAKFTSTGLSAATGARLLTISCSVGMTPQSSGLANLVALSKVSYKSALKCYLQGLVALFACIVVSVILVACGLFT